MQMKAKMKKGIAGKKGFTLVELLVIIAILAIIAVIAIPAVAGLIEKANVSSDTTTVSEMSGAVERWTTEYDLYVNSVQSGNVTADQDVARTRVEAVLNVVGKDLLGGKTVDKLTPNEFREFNQKLLGLNSANGTADGGSALLDTKSKLPTTARGFAAVVQNYTKLKGSSIFVPKQSQMSFYYNIDTGVVTFAASGKSACSDADLTKAVANNNALSGAVGSDGKIDSSKARWIDVTVTTTVSTGAANLETISNAVVGTWAKGTVNGDGTIVPTSLTSGQLFNSAPGTQPTKPVTSGDINNSGNSSDT